jgi:hypothetical protein
MFSCDIAAQYLAPAGAPREPRLRRHQISDDYRVELLESSGR